MERFAEVIMVAGERYIKRPAGSQIPNWFRAMSAVPGIRDMLLAAAERDMGLYSK